MRPGPVWTPITGVNSVTISSTQLKREASSLRCESIAAMDWEVMAGRYYHTPGSRR
jgi:hypothetical protein